MKGLDMENFENWNKKKFDKNLNTNSNTNKRDYDKEPIVLKSYSRLFSSMANTSAYGIAMYLLACFVLFIRDKSVDGFLHFAIIITLILTIANLSKYHIACVKEKTFIVFKNSKIEYLTDGKLKFSVSLEKVLIQGKSLTGSFANFSLIWLIFVAFVFCICVYIVPLSSIIFITFPLFFLVGHIIYRIIWWLAINKSLKNFILFNCINALICEFYDDKSGMNFFMFEDKYGLIYIFNEKDYTDLKEYFLVTKNINIDNLPKRYSPF